MSVLLIGDRADVLLIKYKLLERNWRLDIEQCYSFESAESKLQGSNFNCIVYAPFWWPDQSVQYQKLKALNQTFGVPIRVGRENE
ncbi:hypothetical protein [Microseira wollei]|uniref:Uncharacterized protein n=1 Tax=Microseira wollei NIES-4236 TaxID=2530354 RepID=A0AAV3WPV7_9CYAN|nr:hypothetical protein [Microseira wollei]GET44169.1 hypothetical protein MiSe_89950 [Microseira wollei NIES-4236]